MSSDLAIDQRNPDVLYAGTADYAAETSSVFKTTNSGRSWRPTSMPTASTTIALALHPRNSRVVYAGTDNAVYKSGDAGASWRKVKTARRVYAIVLDPKQPATVYAGSGGGVFKSIDAGRSWKARNVALFPNETPDGHSLAEGFVSAIVVNSRHPQALYLGCYRGVFKSTDGARTWRPVSPGFGGLQSARWRSIPRSRRRCTRARAVRASSRRQTGAAAGAQLGHPARATFWPSRLIRPIPRRSMLACPTGRRLSRAQMEAALGAPCRSRSVRG